MADSAFGRRRGWRGGRGAGLGNSGHKYHAKRTPREVEDVHGRRVHTFPSRKEARRYDDLDLLRRAGLLADLEIEPSFPININGQPVRYESGRAVVARADFRYRLFENGAWKVHVEDVKGVRKTPRPAGVKKPRHEGTDTDVSRLKRALVFAIYGLRVEVV